MNFIISIAEGILFSAVYLFATKRRPKYRLPLMMLFMAILILTVYLLYGGQDEAVWPFFFHPYLSFLILDLADYYVNQKEKFEKLFLWPFFVLPAVCGFILCCGWVLNIHALPELFSALFS